MKSHLLRVFTDLVERVRDAVLPFNSEDAQFIFAGYSWLQKDFRIWTIHYVESRKRFEAREAINFHRNLSKAAFIGDWSKRFRSLLFRELNAGALTVYLEPLKLLSQTLKSAKPTDTIGGPPQIVRITQHMNTRPLCVRWKGEDTLFGRPLFGYENTDYWIVEPDSGKFARPRKFGNRATLSDVNNKSEEGLLDAK